MPLDLESQGANDEQNARFVFPSIWILSDWRLTWLTPWYRYQHLRDRLVSLDQQRQQRQRRLDQLQHLHRLLEPFNNPQEDIQPNLVTRDGDLAQELEKMRMLVARVGARIAQQKPVGQTPAGEYLLPGSDRRVEALMDLDV